MSERRQLINLAYRLLGSLAEAEDAVQETYARWYAMSRQQQAGHRIPRRLADDGRQPHLPRPARLGTGHGGSATWANGSRSRCPNLRSGSAGGADGTDRRPGRPGHPRRVDQHGLPRRARIDDPGRARRVHPARRLPLLLRRSGRDRRPYAGGMPPAGLLGPPPHPRVAGSREPDGPAGRHRQGLQAGMGGQGHRRPHRPPRPRAPRRSPTAAASPAPTSSPIEGGEQIARCLVDIAGRVPAT